MRTTSSYGTVDNYFNTHTSPCTRNKLAVIICISSRIMYLHETHACSTELCTVHACVYTPWAITNSHYYPRASSSVHPDWIFSVVNEFSLVDQAARGESSLCYQHPLWNCLRNKKCGMDRYYIMCIVAAKVPWMKVNYLPLLKLITLSMRSLLIISSTAALDGAQMSNRGLVGLWMAPNVCPGRHLLGTLQAEFARRVSSCAQEIIIKGYKLSDHLVSLVSFISVTTKKWHATHTLCMFNFHRKRSCTNTEQSFTFSTVETIPEIVWVFPVPGGPWIRHMRGWANMRHAASTVRLITHCCEELNCFMTCKVRTSANIYNTSQIFIIIMIFQ